VALVAALMVVCVCSPADAVPSVGAARDLGGSAPIVAVQAGSMAGRAEPTHRRVKIAVVRWSIKRSVSVPLDLDKAATNVGRTIRKKKNQVFTKRMGSYYVGRLWDSATNGMIDPMDVKIGTARLAAPATANMVVPIDLWNNALKSFKTTGSIGKKIRDGHLTLVCFKGSRKADLYGKYQLTVQRRGKAQKAGRRTLTLGVPRHFEYGKKYHAPVSPEIAFDKVSPGEGLKPAVVYNATTKKYVQTVAPLTAIYYNNGIHPVRLDLSFPKIHRKVSVVVKNTRQSLNTRLNTANPIYQAASKLVGTRSEGCAETVAAALKASKVNKGHIDGLTSLRVSLADARTGDVVLDVGHLAILTGPGAMAIHGDVNSHRTFRQKAPLRGAYAVQRPYSNLFS
jgi:hypothetical protein